MLAVSGEGCPSKGIGSREGGAEEVVRGPAGGTTPRPTELLPGSIRGVLGEEFKG